jgi:pyrimidine operon attenuation protein / uracil phosphoribosyltransferase
MTEITSEKTLVLDDGQVRKKISRMAYEIYENNFEEKSLILAGVDGQGYVLAQLLQKELQSISELTSTVVKISIDKNTPENSEVTLDVSAKELSKKNIILVDDVLNTGRILTYGMKPFLSLVVKKIEVAVLVNRSHSLFPVLPKYTGYELSTTLDDHIEVVLKKKFAVYLH